jgi:hypothetical protein
MRLVATATVSMPSDGAALLGLMTIPAFLRRGPAVRLMARRTLDVPLIGEGALGAVARVATGHALLGTMR